MKTSEGGAWALRQSRELVKLGIEVHAMMPAAGPLVSRYQDAGVTVHAGQPSLDTRRPKRWPEQRATLRWLVEQVTPDLIHSHFVGTTLAMRLALGRDHSIPRVFQVPGPLHLEHPGFRQAEIQTAGSADYWVGSCEWTCKRYMCSGVSPRKIALAYYGSDVDTIIPQTPGLLRKELGLDSSVPLVGMVAYMYPPKRYLGQSRGLKGHEDLIDAVEIAQATMPDLQLVVVGGAWNRAKEYEAKLRKYGEARLGSSVHFLGTRSDIPQLYADFDVVAHPSHSENVGGAAESLLLGVPTIATNVGGFPDLVKPGRTGWLVPPKSPAHLAAALLDSLTNREQAKAYAGAGRALALGMMDVRRTARDVANIYESILSDPA